MSRNEERKPIFGTFRQAVKFGGMEYAARVWAEGRIVDFAGTQHGGESPRLAASA